MITHELRDKTLELLRNRSRKTTFEVIEKETSIPVGWLRRFVRDVIEDPGVNRIETLYNYLSETKLKV